MNIGKILMAASLAVVFSRLAIAATAGSCMSSATSISLSTSESTKSVVLTKEYDPDEKEYYDDCGVYYYKVKISKGKTGSIWIDGMSSDLMLSVDTDWEDENAPCAYFDSYFRDDAYLCVLYSDNWDEDDPGSGMFYICISGDVGATCTMHYTSEAIDGEAWEGEDEPVVVTPLGSSGNPVPVTFSTTTTVQDPGSAKWTKSSTWEGGSVYLNTSSLVAGRTYVFGFDGISTNATVTMMLKNGGMANLFTTNALSALIEGCEGACWAVVPETAGIYEIIVDEDDNDFTCWFGADAWDPKDDVTTGATKLTPSSKGVSVDRTLWADDEDWFSFSGAAGTYYTFAFAEKSGFPEIRVYDSKLNECDYTIQTNPCEAVMVKVATKGTYYVKVAHAEISSNEDSPYTLVATSANLGVVKFAKTAVTVKDSAGYVDLSVSRTASEGATRVTYTTAGEQSSAENALYYPTTGTLEWAKGDKSAKKIRVKIVPQNYGQGGTFYVKLAAIDPESEEFDPETEFPAVIADDTARITVTATAKAAPGTIQLADCETPKKPVVNVTATNEIMSLKLERVGGTDGKVSVKVETADKTAKKGTDYEAASQSFTWEDGDAETKSLEIQLRSSSDNTAMKTFTVKLTAVTGKDLAKATLASSTITVNIANDRFATTVAAYSKTLSKTGGVAIKESKSGSWVVDSDGSYRSTLTTGTLTFTLTGPGVFKYKKQNATGEVSEEELPVAYGEKKNNKVVIDASETLLEYVWEPLPDNLETLHQCVKYVKELDGTKLKVSSGKLPDGLKLVQNKTTKAWSISGVPTKAGYYYVKIVDSAATLCCGLAEEYEFNYDVKAAGTAIGTFSGLVEAKTEDGLRSLASVTLTAASTGKLSAKVTVGGKSYSFADTGYASYDAGESACPVVRAELPYVQKIGSGKTAYTVTNWLTCAVVDTPDTEKAGRDAEVTCSVDFAKLATTVKNVYTDDVHYDGKLCRDNSKLTDWVSEASSFAGYYTVSLVNDAAMEGEPKGNGYLTLTFDAKGKVKIAGMLADGTSYSASSVSAWLVDESTVRIPLYACKSTYVFGGWLELELDGDGGTMVVDSSAKLVWANDAATSTRGGEDGFWLEIVPAGGWYDTVTNLQKWFIEYDFSVDLPTWDDDFESLLPSGYETYAFAANPCGQSVDVFGNTVSVVKQSLVKDAENKKYYDFDSSVNASNVKFTFKRATGVLSGTFDLWYEGVNAKTKKFEQKSMTGLKHNGVLLLSRGDDGHLDEDVWTSGFYLVPQTLSDYNELTGRSTTRKWTGSYRFDVKATYIGRDWDATPAE